MPSNSDRNDIRQDNILFNRLPDETLIQVMLLVLVKDAFPQLHFLPEARAANLITPPKQVINIATSTGKLHRLLFRWVGYLFTFYKKGHHEICTTDRIVRVAAFSLIRIARVRPNTSRTEYRS